MPRLVLVRHGRSAHGHAGLLDADGFRRWREAYEAAGILADEVPPPEVASLADASAQIVASEAPRAVESARLLARGRDVLTSPLLRELDLPPPAIPLRMPLPAWALAIGLRSLVAGGHATAEERARVAEAAAWLSSLAAERGCVVAVTHATFRSLLAKKLLAEGWRRETAKQRSMHWSAWIHSR